MSNRKPLSFLNEGLGEETSGTTRDQIGLVVRDVVETCRQGIRIVRNAVAGIADKLEVQPAVNPDAKREYPIGFDEIKVPGGEYATLMKRPQTLFRVEKIVIPKDFAPNFAIVDIKIGKNSQFVAAGEISAEILSEGGKNLRLDTCQVSMDISIIVRNKTSESQSISATAFGVSI